MTNNLCWPRTVLVLVLKVSQPRKPLSLRQTRIDVHPSPPTAISPSGAHVKLGRIHILLSTFLIFQGRSCHTNALQPLSRTVKQTRAGKGHSVFDSQWKREPCHSESSQLLFWSPIRSTSLLAHTGGSKWSWQKLKTWLISVPGETVHPSVTWKCWTPKRRKSKKTQLHRADNSVYGLLRFSSLLSPPSGPSH